MSDATKKLTFRDGFAEGYKLVKGGLSAVPACPAANAMQSGSTPFREGLKAGIKAGGKKLS